LKIIFDQSAFHDHLDLLKGSRLPQLTGSLREELNMTGHPERNRFERALQELQVTLNIARRNSLEDENDTWVLFSDQYLDVVRVGNLSI
jgi:hypothetical protein